MKELHRSRLHRIGDFLFKFYIIPSLPVGIAATWLKESDMGKNYYDILNIIAGIAFLPWVITLLAFPVCFIVTIIKCVIKGNKHYRD